MGRRAVRSSHPGNPPYHKCRFRNSLRHAVESLKTNSITPARERERTMGSDLRDDAAQRTTAMRDAESPCQRLPRGPSPILGISGEVEGSDRSAGDARGQGGVR